MKVVGFCGYSGAGKTTLVEQLVAHFRLAGQRVSVVKHAHHRFDIDHPGKDSFRHRDAGAFEVLVASNQRLALIREYEAQTEPGVHELIAELSPVDWVFVEGFKHADIYKLEVWRPETGKPAQYPEDPFVAAIITSQPEQLPSPTQRPVFHIDDVTAVADYLMSPSRRFEYVSPFHHDSTALDAAGGSAVAFAPGSPDTRA